MPVSYWQGLITGAAVGGFIVALIDQNAVAAAFSGGASVVCLVWDYAVDWWREKE